MNKVSPHVPYELLIERFYSHVMPRIVTFASENCNGTVPNLTYLRIMIGKECPGTGIKCSFEVSI
jgi:hypothetical protein